MDTVLQLIKVRLNRADTALDYYLSTRIEAARDELEYKGVSLNLTMTEDCVFLADYAAWQYLNRDKAGAMPEWLRLALRERFLRNRGDGNAT